MTASMTPTADATPKAQPLMGSSAAYGSFAPDSTNVAGPSHSRTPSGQYFGSSADLYAQSEMPAQSPASFTRPLSSLSMESSGARLANLSGASGPGEGSHHTHGTGESNTNKRASVLSFQTALSGPTYAKSVEGLNGGAATPTSAQLGPQIARGQGQAASGSSGGVGIGAEDGVEVMSSKYANGPPAASSSDLNLPGGWASGSAASRRNSPALRKLELGTAGNEVRRQSMASPSTASTKQSPAMTPQSPLSPTNFVAQGIVSDESAEQTSLERQRTLKAAHSRVASDSLQLKEQPQTPAVAARSAATPLPPPAVPDKEPAPSLPAKESPSPPAKPVNLTSPLSDSVIPPPLPSNVAAKTPLMMAPANLSSPVSDFRTRPLVNVTPAMQAAGVASLQEQKGLAGLGAHNVAGPAQRQEVTPSDGEEENTDVANRRPRAGSNAGMLPRAALVEAPTVPEPLGRSSMEDSAETPSREPSPPPEGEIEARAEWERAMMKRKQKSDKPSDAAGRRTTLRGQLKPLQLVPNEAGGRQKQPSSPYDGMSGISGSSPISNRLNGAPSGAISTQQLQRQQARDQRRSVGAINLAMGGGNDFALGSNGPYPSFPSPSTTATPGGAGIAGGRVYPGMIPQRSLVPPFELQQRPDGLLSGLIGPDGVRRSVNDPEVCLECMMRDEDMIDVHVVGPGLWERESDRDFDDALRTEAEDDARRAADRERGSSATGEDQGSLAGHSSSQQHGQPTSSSSGRAPRTKIRVKRVGQHDPLSADRLKLHTQMNPPASSHRWRTLQNFLAVQAKYIAMEQQARQEEWERTHPVEAKMAKERAATIAMARTGSNDTAASDRMPGAGLSNRKSISRNRSASALLSGPGAGRAQLINDEDLGPEERMLKERDVASAREARRKNVSSDAGLKYNPNKQMPVPPVPPQLNLRTDPHTIDDPQQHRLSSSAGVMTPRRPVPSSRVPPLSRGASASDLRGVPGSMATSPAMPSTPDGLIPPTPLQMSTPRGFGNRTASQLSLAPSGSMLDMHVAVGHGGPASSNIGAGGHQTPNMPLPSPMDLDRERSRSSSPRNFFGFPGDGDASPAMRPSFQQDERSATGPADYPGERRDGAATGKKKKGLRGLFSKISGSASGSNPNMNNVFQPDKRSDGSGSPVQSARRGSMSADSALAPPPGMGGLMGRARRSTSSLLGGRDSVEQVRDLYTEPPSMPNPDRFDMGPFQPPLPPERKQSKLVPEENRGMGLPPMRTSSSSSYGAPFPPSPAMPHHGGASTASSMRGSAPQPPAHGQQQQPRQPVNGSSPSNSRTTSMASMQSRLAPTPQRKLPTIDASPGTETQPLDGMGRARKQARGSGIDQASVRSARTQTTEAFGDGSRQRPESRTSVADSRRSRLSVASKPPFDSLPLRNSSSLMQTPSSSPPMPQGDGAAGRPSLSMPPSRPQRSPRRQESNSSHSTAATANQQATSQPSVQPALPQSRSSAFPPPQQRFSSVPAGAQPYMQPMSVGMPSRNFSGGFTPEMRQELAGQQPQHESHDATISARRGSSGTGASSKADNRKSKLLRLPFGFSGKNKNRSSSLLQPVDGGSRANEEAQAWPLAQPQHPYAEPQEHLASPAGGGGGGGLRAFSAPFETQSLRSRASANALNSGFDDYDDEQRGGGATTPGPSRPRKSMNLFERPRAFSSVGRGGEADLPPRSASALGNLPLSGFVKQSRFSRAGKSGGGN